MVPTAEADEELQWTKVGGAFTMAATAEEERRRLTEENAELKARLEASERALADYKSPKRPKAEAASWLAEQEALGDAAGGLDSTV